MSWTPIVILAVLSSICVLAAIAAAVLSMVAGAAHASWDEEVDVTSFDRDSLPDRVFWAAVKHGLLLEEAKEPLCKWDDTLLQRLAASDEALEGLCREAARSTERPSIGGR